MFLFSFPLQLQRTPTESPILALKADEHHVAKRDVHRNQLAQLTNLVRGRQVWASRPGFAWGISYGCSSVLGLPP